jgi:cytidyltransferase-like protein|tara:strand:- start:1271 stop:2026 length:756 start_codon:yes stop_codon:yes gene_type:complete
MKYVLVTGGFDPLHSGHLAYFKAAKKLGDKLIVGLNSDKWLTEKKGQPFMPFAERLAIIRELECVDNVLSFDDSDGTACGAIFKLMATTAGEYVFANGGDRVDGNVPEYKTYHDKIEFAYGVGGTDKINSSSWILEEYKNPKTVRSWGWYRVLDNKPGYKVKELVIEPGKSLSMQRHRHRSENWYVLKGTCVIQTNYDDRDEEAIVDTNCSYTISQNVWHKGINNTQEHCHILEVQFGDKCIEQDIERKEE